MNLGQLYQKLHVLIEENCILEILRFAAKENVRVPELPLHEFTDA